MVGQFSTRVNRLHSSMRHPPRLKARNITAPAIVAAVTASAACLVFFKLMVGSRIHPMGIAGSLRLKTLHRSP
jgi:hypothetical protein